MNNNTSNAVLSKLNNVDKVVSLLILVYGIYLYVTTGVLNNGELILNPLYLMIGGSLSFVLSLINIPNIFLSRMKNKMVVNR
jgi:hypothetical protein